MINRINQNSVNRKNIYPSKNQPQFKGGPADVLIAAVQMCEKNPMVNVAVLDLATAIVPRTIIESETNPYAGFEAFRRESSGLIVNCMIPSIIVLGIAKAVESPIMGGHSNMGSCWASENTIDLVSKYWKETPESPVIKNGKTLYTGEKAKVYNTIKKILEDTEGVDGTEVKSFNGKNFDESITKLTENVYSAKYSKKETSEAFKKIVAQTNISENIKIKGHGKEYYGESLESVIRDTPKILKDIVHGKTHDAASFASKAKRLLNTKSFLGLGVIIPLAISMQPLNRWITEKMSGKKGAPIYKDFAHSQAKELTPKEKSDLFKQKLVSVGSMVGVALLSMMKLPAKQMFQFKGIFPTMDQARLISTATFASRMASSEDKNDLREATVRDIATFSSFYFLGDYVAKGIASGIEKANPHIKLINVLEKSDKNAGPLQKFWHWAKHTSIKSSDELVGANAKRMRSICQLGNIGFSLVALGLLIPMYNRHKTDEKRKEELKNMGFDKSEISKYYPHFMKNNPNFASRANTYKAFSTSK